ncbi:MAG: Rne/Rng family ribonuclease [Actinobacteria bacterium]|nr:Rne/Rng family ribonuclease [Actinomycetota bacterium]
MAIVPKGARKRASKKSAAKAAVKNEAEAVEVAETETKATKKSAAASIPVPMFQAAPEAVAPKKVKAKAEVAEPVESSEESESDSNSRRRRRGGRGRRRGVRDTDETNVDRDSDTDEELDVGDISEASEDSPTGPRRRRRRRAKGDGVTHGETIEEDGVITVVKVREPRERKVRDDQGTRSDRPDRGGRNRNRNDRGNRNRNDREPRDFVRRRGTVITESEYLARRENVDRQMLVRQAGDRTQIAVLEDKIMVEHYVNRNSNISYVGNVYLGKVQNVLPSMEAAFVDIGKGRNAVLYAGEVNWDTAGLADGAPRKIEHVLKTGQSVLVQVTKDPIGQKGARLTSQISLPGRYLVYVPSGEMSGISRRLPDQERSRLKTILKNLIPDDAGVIVRTASEGASEEELERDVIRLKAQWEDIDKKSKESGTNAPALLYSEPDLTVRVIRDIFNEDFDRLIVQGDQAWDDINNYLGHIAPELTAKIEKWTGTRDLFVENRIEEQLAKAFDRKVYLPSGGSLVIDRTEAMIVIDVNTGKFIGKGGNLEETVTKNNLEAAEEIARQLRLRDMGGIVVIDFIDMTLESNRDLVLRRLIECLGRDRTKHQVAEVTSLGLVQMTRKRVGQGLIEAFSTTCESCGGRGIHIHSEPVTKVALDKDMEQRYVPQVHEEETEPVDSIETEEVAEIVEVAEVKAPAQKRRRRAVSTGVITPE